MAENLTLNGHPWKTKINNKINDYITFIIFLFIVYFKVFNLKNNNSFYLYIVHYIVKKK